MRKLIFFFVISLFLGNGILNAQTSLRFDGVDDYVNCGNDASVQITGAQLTLEATINVNEFHEAIYMGPIINKEGGPVATGYMLRTGGNGNLDFYVMDGSDWIGVGSPANSITAGQWHHVAGTFNDNVLKLYVDGVEIGRNELDASKTIANTADSVDLYIGGSRTDRAKAFNGQIKDARVWNVERTAAQIAEFAFSDLTGAEAGLVAYYKFADGTGQVLTDEKGTNDGELGSTAAADDNDPAWATIYEVTNMLYFDGADDYVNCGTDASLGTGSAITVEAWINATEFKDQRWQGTILGRAQGLGAGKDFGYFMRAGGDGSFDFGFGDGSWHEISSPGGVLKEGEWAHVAYTYDGDTMMLFLNGEWIAGGGYTGEIVTPDTIDFPMRIGESAAWPGRAFNGYIDEVRIWDIARTEAQIAADMHNTALAGDASGLVAYYQFDEGTGQTTDDKTGVNDAFLGDTIIADDKDPSWADEVAPKLAYPGGDNSLIFDGTNDFVNCGNDASVQVEGSALTVEAWINVNQFKDAMYNGPIVNKEAAATDHGYMLRAGGNGAIDFYIMDGTTAIGVNSGDNAVSGGTWHHVAGVFDDDTMFIYVNGLLVNSGGTGGSKTIVDADGVDLYIGGCATDAAKAFDGSIDEVRVWNTARTQTEIVSAMNLNISGEVDGLVAYYRMDEGEGQTTADETGTNDGQLGSTDGVDTNDPIWDMVDPVDYDGGNSLIFDGAGDLVDCGNDASVQVSGSQLTLEAWFNATQFKDAVWQGCLITKDQSDTVAYDEGYMIRVGGNGQVNFNIGAEGTDAGWNEIFTSQEAVQEGTWHHVAAVYDGNKMAIYIDGVLQASAIKPGITVGTAESKPLYIGESPAWPGRSFNGMIDEVRVWNVARSLSDIRANMTTSVTGDETGLVAAYDMEEGQGQVAGDATGTNDGQLGNEPEEDDNDPIWRFAAPIDYDQGNSLTFDGTNDFVNCGSADAISIEGGALTVEAWINPSSFRDAMYLGPIVNKEATTAHGYMLRCGGNGAIDFYIMDGTDWIGVNSGDNVVTVDTWHHVAGVFDGNNLVIYVDGNETNRNELTEAATIADADGIDLYIGGCATDAAKAFPGKIDEVRIWNVARPLNLIRANMASDLSGLELGLAASYDFEEGCGQEAGDLTQNSNGQLGSTPDVDDNDPAWTTDDCGVDISTITTDNLEVYPNPFIDQVRIKSELEISKVVVTDIVGKLVMEEDVYDTTKDLDLSSVSSGLYYISVFYSDGKVEVTNTIKK